jgi:anti-sigma B factor antagonist
MSFEVLGSEAESVVLALHGELDLSSVDEFERRLEAAISKPDQRPVVIDLRELTFMDSSGLRALVAARNRASDLGRELRLRGVAGQIRRLLDITSLSGDFIIVAD